MAYDNRPPRHGKPGPVRYEDPPPPPPPPIVYDARSPYEPEPHGFPINNPRSPDPPKQYYGDASLRPTYNPGLPNRGYKPGQHEPLNSDPPVPPPKPEVVLSPGEHIHSATPKPLPPPPREDPEEEDPAMKPQSVLNRVKMFENKRSVSVDRAKEVGDVPGIRVWVLFCPPPMNYKTIGFGCYKKKIIVFLFRSTADKSHRLVY